VQRRVVPAIVFHGDRDTTVNPRNGDAVVAQSARIAALSARAEKGQVPDGHAYSRTLHADANGQTMIASLSTRIPPVDKSPHDYGRYDTQEGKHEQGGLRCQL
jgi:hypothetical protein